MKQRNPITELPKQRETMFIPPAPEPPSLIRLVHPIHTKNALGHMSAFAVLDVPTFERKSHSLVCDFEGVRREIFYANIAEIVAK